MQVPINVKAVEPGRIALDTDVSPLDLVDHLRYVVNSIQCRNRILSVVIQFEADDE